MDKVNVDPLQVQLFSDRVLAWKIIDSMFRFDTRHLSFINKVRRHLAINRACRNSQNFWQVDA